MIEDRLNEFGIYRLRYPLKNFEIVLDTRRATITFEVGYDNEAWPNLASQVANSDQKATFSIRLDKFKNFEEDLEVRHPSSTILMSSLRRMADNQESINNEAWREALGRFTFLLARYANKHNGTYHVAVKDLVLWMGVHGASTAWRIFYDDSLNFEHRYDLLRSAQHSLSQSDTRAEREKIALDAPEQKERQLLWWTTFCKYDLARQWCESETYGNPAARHALRESALNYLQVLKDEARQRDLRRFLTEGGTDLEHEVKRILFPKWKEKLPPPSLFSPARARPKPPTRRLFQRLKDRIRGIPATTADRTLDLAKDEVIRRTFFVWFLKRYAWWSAVKLILSDSKKDRMLIAGCTFFLFVILGAGLYLIQIGEFPRIARVLPPFLSAKENTPFLWGMQVLFQLAALISVLAIAPLLFRLLMPRALFGSLLAWCTVIFTALRDVHELRMDEGGEKPWHVWQLCHTCSDTQALKYSLLISLGILILDSIFIAYAVTQFTDGFLSTVVRTLSTLAGLLAGSLFWGLIFALPIKVALERDVFRFDCSCVIPIVLIGASIAVLFGLMVELIWQDQSLAEPLGEPL